MKMKERLRKLAFTATALVLTINILAQQRTITGKVVDADNQPLTGVTVVVKNRPASATATNGNGVFSIDANTGDVLEFSSVGYKKIELKLGAGNTANIALETNTVLGDEVVVVGYGTLQRKNVTSSIVSVKPDIIPKSA